MVEKLTRLLHLKYSRFVNGVTVPDAPDFDARGLEYFLRRIGGSRLYLEYGSGGSTVIAAREAGRVLTVDNDRAFLEAVCRKIRRDLPASRLECIHVRTGLTTRWGNPLFTGKSAARVAAWERYPAAPWERILEHPAPAPLPDLILVDGRFRVACALLSIRNLRGAPDFEMLVDDYEGRPHYNEIAKHARLVAMHGRMAVFGPKPVNETTLNESLRQYAADWR